MQSWYKISKDITDKELADFADPKWEKVESSVIDEIAYHPMARVLEIKFKSGRTYTYMGVPPETYTNLKNADSKGSFFNERIKHEFRFR